LIFSVFATLAKIEVMPRNRRHVILCKSQDKG
jgi:hypothetical protein